MVERNHNDYKYSKCSYRGIKADKLNVQITPTVNSSENPGPDK